MVSDTGGVESFIDELRNGIVSISQNQRLTRVVEDSNTEL
jgi:hypothetical protein